jgi:hypothetical protein
MQEAPSTPSTPSTPADTSEYHAEEMSERSSNDGLGPRIATFSKVDRKGKRGYKRFKVNVNFGLLAFIVQAIISIGMMTYVATGLALDLWDNGMSDIMLNILTFILGVWMPNPTTFLKTPKKLPSSVAPQPGYDTQINQ